MTLNFSSGTWSSFWTAQDAEAKASLCSKRSISSMVMPAFSMTCLDAGMGASMISSGLTPFSP